MERRISSPAKYRFEDRVLFFIVPLFPLVFILSFWGFHYYHIHLAGSLAYLCAFMTSLPILGFIVVYGLYLAEEKDEFQRAICVQSMLWGIGATLAVTTFWGSLEKIAPVPHMDISSVQFLFLVVMVIAQWLIRWSYR
jgi:hypothetical protein